MRTAYRIILGAVALLSSACDSVSKTEAPAIAAVAQSQIVRVDIPGPSLEGNLSGDETVKSALVYLPPSYETERDRRYPLLVLLHGYWSGPEQWEDEAFSITTMMNSAIAAGEAAEMIIVMPNGSDRLNGGFYVNGAASGDWEDYIAEDVVAFADKTLRTKASRDSRGLAGHSMGGYGALSIAINRPDVFSAVYAMSPCCGDLIADFDLNSPAWRSADTIDTMADFNASEDFYGRVLIAIGAAWSPDADSPMHSRRPVNDGVINQEIVRLWGAQTLAGKVEQDAGNLRKLNGIALDVGDREEFGHILVSTPALSKRLTKLGIEHDFEVYPGDHVSGVGTQLRRRVIPFFSEHLADAN